MCITWFFFLQNLKKKNCQAIFLLAQFTKLIERVLPLYLEKFNKNINQRKHQQQKEIIE